MKKEVRLYNIFFPLWFLVLCWPLLVPSIPILLLLLPLNFAFDSLVLLVAAKVLGFRNTKPAFGKRASFPSGCWDF